MPSMMTARHTAAGTTQMSVPGRWGSSAVTIVVAAIFIAGMEAARTIEEKLKAVATQLCSSAPR